MDTKKYNIQYLKNVIPEEENVNIENYRLKYNGKIIINVSNSSIYTEDGSKYVFEVMDDDVLNDITHVIEDWELEKQQIESEKTEETKRNFIDYIEDMIPEGENVNIENVGIRHNGKIITSISNTNIYTNDGSEYIFEELDVNVLQTLTFLIGTMTKDSF